LSARYHESFTVEQPVSEYHYTLYYYDQAGNLVKTVPPAGVDVSRFGHIQTWLDSVATYRQNKQRLVPAHGLQTDYRYNSLNQVVAQQSPDGGKTEFWYDRLGRLAVSSNARQKANMTSGNNRLYSYTRYDHLGRITEVGQVRAPLHTFLMSDEISRSQSGLDGWMAALTNLRGQITQTVYDVPYDGFVGLSPTPLVQRNLRNRVSYTAYIDSAAPVFAFNQATFFSYDIHGNVDTLLQHYGRTDLSTHKNIMNMNGNPWKKIVYRYDLISGKVNHVAYNPKNVDEFYHNYTYDAENRLTLVETSSDSLIWEKDARYEYYKHGPLARMAIGDQLVQGVDYAYTLQGWLKGVNSTVLRSTHDMGEDGKDGSVNQYTAKDAIGFNLNYFTGDYSAINTGVNPFPGHTGYFSSGSYYRPLFNGNISSMAVNIKALNSPRLYTYSYDQLNRLTGMDSWTGLDTTNNNWSGLATSNEYRERIRYDANGNILKYNRYTDQVWGGAMDSLTYIYYGGTNRLRQVRDSGTNYYSFNPPDIHDQTSTNNYTYDEIGNLITDDAEYITSVSWNVYGKIREINRTASTYNPVTKIQYTYDAAGNRIGKTVWKSGTPGIDYTWYVRDAQGNVLKTYHATGSTSDTSLSQPTLNVSEQVLYGSSRLGLTNVSFSAEGTFFERNNYSTLRGFKQYELTNHLGNVLATVSDLKKPVASSVDPNLIAYYD
jgi:YD repeat-containing protein